MNKPYNKLNQNDKDIIISNYYNNVDLNFKELASICNVSERAFSRVLKENNINTKVKNRYIIKNEHYFDNIDTETKAYFLGLLFADGHVGSNNEIILYLKDIGNTYYVLNVLIKELESNIKIKRMDTKNKEGCFKSNSFFYKLNMSNKCLNNALKQHGVGNHKKSSRFEIPKDVLSNNLENHFIRGLFDGDGSVYLKNKNKPTPQKTVSFLANPSLLLQIKHILEKELKLNNVQIRKSYNSDKISELRYGGNNQVQRISNYLYSNANIYLSHKKF